MTRHTVIACVAGLLGLATLTASGQKQEAQRESSAAVPAYPVLRSDGNPGQNQIAYERELEAYDQKKQALVSRAVETQNTNANAAATTQSLSGKFTGNTLQSNCIIPRDGSWIAVPRNDDGSMGPIALPFAFDLYGTNYTNVWINTNGNLTFTGAFGTFTPTGFPIGTPMVAPFWADVDTRNGACGQIYYKMESSRMLVLWDHVGFYASDCSRQNTFQVIIGTYTDPVIGIGNNVKFNYGDMQWTTGSASGGSGGFGGSAATAGINKGNGVNWIQIGRFSTNTSSYDGPGGANDGISYLDDRCYGFNVSTASNIAPVFSGLPEDNTVTIEAGQSTSLLIQAIPPEMTQTNSVVVSTTAACGVTASTTSGPTADASIDIAGSLCNLGSSTITLAATDDASTPLTSTVVLTLNVTCPGIGFTSCPADIVTGNDQDNCSAVVNYTAEAASNIAVTYTYAFSGATTGSGSGTGSGATFSKGVTTVEVTATNGCDSRTCTFTVTVNDTQAPVATVNPSIALWPPNHSYVTVSASDMVSAVADNCATLSAADVVITSVTSDEPEDATGNGDGSTVNDIVIAADCKSVDLRRERQGGGNGRVYTVHFTVSDPDGNTSAYAFTASVPHSEFGAATDDGAASGYSVYSPCAGSPRFDGRAQIPAGYALEQNYPNPFNPATLISYSIPQDAPVRVSVMDLYGRTVAVLVDARQNAGTHSVSFDASGLGSGMYLYTLRCGDVVVTKTMNLLK